MAWVGWSVYVLLAVGYATILLHAATPRPSAKPPATVTVGVMRSLELRDLAVQQMFDKMVEEINRRDDILPDTTLKLISAITETSTIPQIQAIQKAFDLIQAGSYIIIGPGTSSAANGASYVTKYIHVPQIDPEATDPAMSYDPLDNPYLLKMSSPDSIQNEALVDIVEKYDWHKLAFLYEDSDYGRNGVSSFIKLVQREKWVVAANEHFDSTTRASELNVTQQLLAIRDTGAVLIVVYSLGEKTWTVIDQAYELGMMSGGWAWLTSEGVTVTTLPYERNTTTGNRTVPARYQGILGTVASLGLGELYSDALELIKTLNSQYELVSKVYLCRWYDSLITAVVGLDEYIKSGLPISGPSYEPDMCERENDTAWEYGEELRNVIRTVQTDGAMNFLNFTNMNYPWAINFDVVNLRDEGWVTIGSWKSSRSGAGRESLSMTGSPIWPGGSSEVPRETNVDISNVTLKVATVLITPFVMKTASGSGDQYEGYCIDLLKELQQTLEFNYELYRLPHTNSTGIKDPLSQSWNGLMAEVINGNADLGLGPVSVTEERYRYVDFTQPFMDISFSVLVHKKEPQDSFFAFLDPFQLQLWIGVIVATVVFGMVVALCSFLSPSGWRGRYTQRVWRHDDDARESKSRMSYHHAGWFSITSLLKQGPEHMPRSLSGRMAAGFWWTAVMIFQATYTANLAAFLTVARMDTGVMTLTDLASQKELLYGTVRGSLTDVFFSEQDKEPFPQMYTVMKKFDTWVDNASEGFARVRDPDVPYGFIYNSVQLLREAKSPPCEVRTIKETFGHMGFGLILAKKSPYTRNFTNAILRAQEKGVIDDLAAKWITGECDNEAVTPSASYSLGNLGGVFFLLAGGMVLAVVATVIEYLTSAQKDALREAHEMGRSRGFWFHLKRRVHVTASNVANHVCRRRSTADENHADNENTDEIANNTRAELYETKFVRYFADYNGDIEVEISTETSPQQSPGKEKSL